MPWMLVNPYKSPEAEGESTESPDLLGMSLAALGLGIPLAGLAAIILTIYYTVR